MLSLEDRIRGGLWGLLIGDALGVPYEFHSSKEIPAWEDIEMVPPVALEEVKAGASPTRSGFVNPNGKGNGSLMRVLPLALWHPGSDAELIEDAHMQSIVTHGPVTNQVVCALYCLWARRLMDGLDTDTAYACAVASLRQHYGDSSDYRRDVDMMVRPDDAPTTDGSGYVVATLHAARLALQESSFEGVVRRAIRFGNDTDTNAAVAGGLAGIRQGVRNIPRRWMDALRGKDQVKPLLESLVEMRTR